MGGAQAIVGTTEDTGSNPTLGTVRIQFAKIEDAVFRNRGF